jgi:hypothetical protein
MGSVGSKPDPVYWVAPPIGPGTWDPDILATWGLQHVQMVFQKYLDECFGFMLDRESFALIMKEAGIIKVEMSVIRRGVNTLDEDLWDLLTEPEAKRGKRKNR